MTYEPIAFEWDAAKSEHNRLIRDLPFELAIELFRGSVVIEPDSRRDYGEARWRATGTVGGLILVCIFTERGETCRIISLRRARRRARDAHHSQNLGRH
jgi:uncharacterized DUF497 family protein